MPRVRCAAGMERAYDGRARLVERERVQVAADGRGHLGRERDHQLARPGEQDQVHRVEVLPGVDDTAARPGSPPARLAGRRPDERHQRVDAVLQDRGGARHAGRSARPWARRPRSARPPAPASPVDRSNTRIAAPARIALPRVGGWPWAPTTSRARSGSTARNVGQSPAGTSRHQVHAPSSDASRTATRPASGSVTYARRPTWSTTTWPGTPGQRDLREHDRRRRATVEHQQRRPVAHRDQDVARRVVHGHVPAARRRRARRHSTARSGERPARGRDRARAARRPRTRAPTCPWRPPRRPPGPRRPVPSTTSRVSPAVSVTRSASVAAGAPGEASGAAASGRCRAGRRVAASWARTDRRPAAARRAAPTAPSPRCPSPVEPDAPDPPSSPPLPREVPSAPEAVSRMSYSDRPAPAAPARASTRSPWESLRCVACRPQPAPCPPRLLVACQPAGRRRGRHARPGERAWGGGALRG